GRAFRTPGRSADAPPAAPQAAKMRQDDPPAPARLQTGECRAKQSKWADAGKEFQAVYYAYDIPELKFAAMLEHARVLVEDKKQSEEHTSELQSPYDLVCRLLLEKKKKNKSMIQ